jgi:hypothetical protein
MLTPAALLADLQRLVRELEDDLRERAGAVAELDALLRAEHGKAAEAHRTAEAFEVWRDESLTQAAVAWVLGCVFVRFLEDNRLVDEPRLAGPGERLQHAKDHHTLYFQQHPHDSDREYLLAVFTEVAALPAVRELFDRRHNLVWQVGVSGDGATRLLEFWQRIDPTTGALVYDFTDPEWNTRFLGDLYQDLSEAARKKYALLQTPEFVEELILDRTLTPAIEEFGYKEVRLIDPTCGSGHFLLGGFRRLFDLWARNEPGTNVRELAQRALNHVCGVDLNPFAVAIARFRLLVAALRVCGITRLADAPAFHVSVAAGDSLLHGPRFTETRGVQLGLDPADRMRHVYLTEDREELARILGRQYHAVVGNPPYITVKDRALNQAYRDRYGSCHRQYSLAVPFTERFFDLALPASGSGSSPSGRGQVRGSNDSLPHSAGHVGMITANSFMKREFGKKLVETYIPRWDLTHVIDTSGAYIPGHGTPTVILFGRHRRPVGDTVRAVMGIRGEPATPEDPARGLVWRAIVEQIDRPGSQSEYVSVADTAREGFHKHPWSIGGGGAAELKRLIEEAGTVVLGALVEAIGRTTVVGEDDAWITVRASAERQRIGQYVVPFCVGEGIRDWAEVELPWVLYPYESLGGPAVPLTDRALLHYLWPYRTPLSSRSVFGKSLEDMGRPWYEHLEHYTHKLRTPLSIAFAFVATHNHFVLDRGGKVFNRSAPVIKLPPDASEDDHLALLGLLNSSVACFWMKQVFQPKSHASQRHHPDPARAVYEFAATALEQFPIPESYDRRRSAELAREIDRLATERRSRLSATIVAQVVRQGAAALKNALRLRWRDADEIRERMVALQEELDWTAYRSFQLVVDHPDLLPSGVPIADFRCPRGQRPFERIHGRRSLIRHGGKVVPPDQAEAPRVGDLSTALESVWARRQNEIRSNPYISLIERVEYKRVWRDTEDNVPEPDYRRTLDDLHLREWLLDHLEAIDHWPQVELISCRRLADRVRQDADFMQVAEVYRGHPDFDVTALVTELVESEAVPFLPVLRYKATGLRKRALWERTWELQRKEDAGEKVGDIPVPPKYASADFLNGTFWRLRGKLDVPKERFISYPHAERDVDPTPVIAWAGWDHLQQAQALAAYYVQMKENEGWPPDRLTPLLAGLLELIPWLKQWHNALDPTHGVRMGDYFADFVAEEARTLGLTQDQVRAWAPPTRALRARRRRSAS